MIGQIVGGSVAVVVVRDSDMVLVAMRRGVAVREADTDIKGVRVGV